MFLTRSGEVILLPKALTSSIYMDLASGKLYFKALDGSFEVLLPPDGLLQELVGSPLTDVSEAHSQAPEVKDVNVREYDGVSQYDRFTLNDGYDWEEGRAGMLINLDAITSTDVPLCIGYVNGAISNSIAILVSAANVSFRLYRNDGTYTTIAGTAPTLGEWLTVDAEWSKAAGTASITVNGNTTTNSSLVDADFPDGVPTETNNYQHLKIGSDNNGQLACDGKISQAYFCQYGFSYAEGEGAPLCTSSASATNTVSSGVWASADNITSANLSAGHTPLYVNPSHLNTGAQAGIDTGLKIGATSRIEFRFKGTADATSADRAIFGAGTFADTSSRCYVYGNPQTNFKWFIGSTLEQSVAFDTEWHDVVIDIPNSKVVFDGTDYAISVAGLTGLNNLYLNGNGDNTASTSLAGEFAYFKMYEGGVLLRDYVPTSDGGWIDKVNLTMSTTTAGETRYNTALNYQAYSGSYLQTDGVGSYADLGGLTDVQYPVTIEAEWYGQPDANEVIASLCSPTTTTDYIILQPYSNGQVVAFVRNAGGEFHNIQGDSGWTNPNGWNRAKLTLASATEKYLEVNGHTKLGTVGQTYTIPAEISRFTVGGNLRATTPGYGKYKTRYAKWSEGSGQGGFYDFRTIPEFTYPTEVEDQLGGPSIPLTPNPDIEDMWGIEKAPKALKTKSQLTLDGVGDHITLSQPPTDVNSLRISGEINIDSLPCYIYGFSNAQMRFEATRTVYYPDTSGSAVILDFIAPVGEWFTYEMYDDGSFVTMYKDGVQQGAAKTSLPRAQNPAWATYGKWNTGYVNGMTRKFKIEVSGATLAEYDFTKYLGKTTTTIDDESGSGNDGTVVVNSSLNEIWGRRYSDSLGTVVDSQDYLPIAWEGDVVSNNSEVSIQQVSGILGEPWTTPEENLNPYLADGDTDWTHDIYWDVTVGQATHNPGVGVGSLYQNSLTVGKKYSTTITVDSVTSDGLLIKHGTAQAGDQITAAGTYTLESTCAGDGLMRVTPFVAGAEFTISAVSTKEVTGSSKYLPVSYVDWTTEVPLADNVIAKWDKLGQDNCHVISVGSYDPSKILTESEYNKIVDWAGEETTDCGVDVPPFTT